MLSLSRWLLVPALLMGGLLLANPVAAQKGVVTVQDDAGFFSQDAIRKANGEIARIKSQHKRDVMIETIAKPPVGTKDLDAWVAQRFNNQHVDGVAIYILRDPQTMRIVIGKKTKELGLFTPANRDELKKKIADKLTAGDNDGALAAAVTYVSNTMALNGRSAVGASTNTPRAEAPGKVDAPAQGVEPIPWLRYILIGVGVLFVLWIVMAIIRGFSSAGGGAPGMGGYGGGGGGGFMTGFLGGMFGAAAGMWMYNSFFGGQSSSAWASPPSSPTGVNDASDIGAGDPDVGGGDYGADAGGKQEPDWGGGNDAGGDWGGGGDVGGGDWGGGGDVGGGGGDW